MWLVGRPFHLPFHAFYAFSCDRPLHYKEVLGIFLKRTIDIKIESRVTLLKIKWVLCETCSPFSSLIFWVLGALKWRHSSLILKPFILQVVWPFPCLQPHKFLLHLFLPFPCHIKNLKHVFVVVLNSYSVELVCFLFWSVGIVCLLF